MSAGYLLTGWAGIAAFTLLVPTVALYFLTSQPPTVRTVLTRVLLSLLLCIALLAFTGGFSALLRQVPGSAGWLADLVLGSGLVLVVVTIVANAVQAGAALRAGRPIDPTLIGAGAESSQVMYGPVTRLITAVYLTVLGVAILGSGITPAWLGWSGIAVAAAHLALVPTLLSTTDPARFYSLNGWSIPVAGGLLLCWILATSIALLSSPVA